VRPFSRALISAVTLFGGHFLNRRLDRVVLVGALLVVAVMGFVGVPYALFPIDRPTSGLIPWLLRLPLILFGALALLSAGLTFSDARQPAGAPLTTTMRVTGTALSLVGVLLISAALIVSASRYVPASEMEAGTAAAVPSAIDHPFDGYVSFGGGAETFDLPAPPAGPERLRGRITLDRDGAEGMELELILNDKYKVDELTTDSRGVFEVPLPAGDWRINSVVVRAWDARPRHRQLVLFSRSEPTRGADRYSRYGAPTDAGFEVSLPFTATAIPVELELRDALAMTWPPSTNSFELRTGRAEVPEVDFSTATISWQPVKGASEYEVQIAHVTRKGTTTIYTPILMRRASGPTLPLASLPQRSASSAPADEYSVRVYAFDTEGLLLTESGASDGRIFKLAGGTRLGKEQQYSFGPQSAQVISVEYETNELRLSLVEKLLDKRAFDEARRLLDQVTEDAPRGRASALRGRLAALQGDCVTATRLFNQADVEGGAGCVPIEDRRLCAAPQR
jgi:hypothetical protein